MPVANLRWLQANRGATAAPSAGVSFGVPWPKGLYQRGQTFVIEGSGEEYELGSREIAFWPDGSLKWTAHSLSSNVEQSESYTVKGSASGSAGQPGVSVDTKSPEISISTRLGLQVKFSQPGHSSIFKSIQLKGQQVCTGATLIASINKEEFVTKVNGIQVENATASRVVIKVSGVVVSSDKHKEHLPFDVRVYVYSDAPTIKIAHSFIHDLNPDEPLTSLGLRFLVPLGNTELYNRHIRLGGAQGGILKEEVQGLSGLRHGPTIQNRIDQTAGKVVTLTEGEWQRTELNKGLSYIPSWDAYSLAQLSSDGFTIKKRTKAGCSWVKVTGGGRADGTAYIGSADQGGLAVGMSDFWERYPTQIDLDNLTKEEGTITTWLYSPLAEPLETTPYHDGLGLDTYPKQLEALNVTYEDYEPGFATANGIGRSNQFFIRPYLATPSNEELSSFGSVVRDPPRLIPTAEYMHSTGVFYGSWAPDFRTLGYSPSKEESDIEKNLDLLFNYYRDQVEQQRWYGFWDYGDVQHTYDPYRHAWRYDVGGFAWDNSELSTDLWLWLYFLHTGRADAFKMAEAMTRHTGEVDVYHSGQFKGFGTRHGVQHWSDSSKQLRISSVLYRRIYFYLTGDERIGDLIEELQECQTALLGLDSHRKVQEHDSVPDGFAMTNIGLDCGPMAAAWLTAWERRTEGWERARDLLVKMLDGLAGLTHGIGNNAILLNPSTGEIRECPPPTPAHHISHLSMLFGFPEIFNEVLHIARDEHPEAVAKFTEIWLAYGRAYNGGHEVQRREFGFEFPDHATWRQSHSTLTGLAAVAQGNDELAQDAWRQFFDTDGYRRDHGWEVLEAKVPEYFNPGAEAPWITTNEAARFGVSAIVNLANIRKYLK
ncbi:hypothetical protein BX600DRAFT_518865 [Xylariales sp. PMI_506]|nr:hypothetical protein BX600DRAFT_518865 [Xylariales sp. PMI_506]